MRQIVSALLFSFLLGTANSQTTTAPLSDYVGTYTFEPGQTLEIVAGDVLFAVLDKAKYKLSPSGVDEFSTITGNKIPFRRDASGKVTGYEQDGKFHPRISTTISPEAAALAYPRPVGQNSPEAYRYQIPTDRHDGIAIGDIDHSDLGTATANTI
jgi:Domain of unknown function (DUF3471)